MIIMMHSFATFMTVEDSRCYIDELYSPDPEKCLRSLTCIKNSVIGSNRQKESVIAQGVVPRLMQILQGKTNQSELRAEAAVTIGSLAKGTQEHIDCLINSGTIEILLDVLEEPDIQLVDACLCCLRTLNDLDSTAIQTRCTTRKVQHIVRLAGHQQSLQRQTCVMSILKTMCRSANEQNELGALGAPEVIANLLTVNNSTVTLPAIACLSTMCLNNPQVSSVVVQTLSKDDLPITSYLSTFISRDKPVKLQLEAARCLTNLHRAGAIRASDTVITFRTLPCLVRLCQPNHSESDRITAAELLAYLTEVDSDLQQIAAISNQLVNALVNLLSCRTYGAKQAAFRAFASLAANDEDIRKRIIDTKCLMDNVLEGLDDENENIRLAAVRCLHSLSRSVQQLRTTFQDHSVWRPLMTLLTGSPSTELLTAASSALCNLLLEFSPAKEPMLQQGVVQLLAGLTMRPEASLRLNGVWALMNLAFQAEQRVKSQILTALGTDQIFRLLADADVGVLMKTLGLLRNLVSPRVHTDSMMALHGPQVMQGVVLVLEGPHAPEVKEQALCILANIADGEKAREHIMSNEDVLKKLKDYMTHPAACLQEASVFCISNLARLGEPGSMERQTQLKDLGVVNTLHQLLSTSDTLLYNRIKTALSLFTDA